MLVPPEALSAEGGRYRRSRIRASGPPLPSAGPASMVLPRPTSSAISKLVRGIDRARTTGSSWYSSISMPGRNGACSDVLGAPGDPGGVAGGDAARAHVRHHPLPVADGHELPGLGDGARFLGLHVCGSAPYGSALCGVALGGVADVARGQALGVHRQPSSFLAPVIPGAGVSPPLLPEVRVVSRSPRGARARPRCHTLPGPETAGSSSCFTAHTSNPPPGKRKP